MSRLPSDEPTDGPHHAVPLGRAPLERAPLGSTGEPAGRSRRKSLLRHDIADDPGQGVALYEALAAQNTSSLSADEWADRIEAIERVKARLAAWEAEGIAGFDDALHGNSADLGHRYPEPGDRPAAPGERRWGAGDLRSVSDELALILNLRRPHATARIHTSCELVHNFPVTLHALSEGWLIERAAFTIVGELSVLEDINDLRAAETAVLAWARTHPLTDLKKECQRQAARRSPAASTNRHRRAHEERSVRMIPDGDGRAVLVHDQDAVDAAAIMTSLSRAAARARRNGDPRSSNQLRADIALSRLLRRAKRTNPASVVDEPAIPGNYPATTEQSGTAAEEPLRRNDHADTVSSDDPHDLTPPNATEPPYDLQAPAPTEPPYDTSHEPLDNHAYELDDDRGNQWVDDHAYKADGDHAYKADGDCGLEPLDDRGLEPVGDCGYEAPEDYSGVGHSDGDRADDFEGTGEPDPELVDETLIGAEAMVVIHATAAEVNALINGKAATGGEADHHGPIPQSTLRKHLIKAITQGLLPNLPATPTSPHPGATTRRPRTAFGIELRITDQPPPSDPDRYTPSAALDRYVRWRDRTCQFPGCNRPAEFADLDHRIPFAVGGRTTAANLWCLCRHHHRLKHEGGWQIHPNPDGSYTWTSPTGRSYRNNATIYQPPDPTDQHPPPERNHLPPAT
ncbi:DUF222 domain-containing protein [Kribbella sp. NPDC006257]|uniref:HNH endonuclease signature motif containing protein n=1 Tax=Kribbella sp. NPDC006257 TaxID=3156738 RepID=UPI0033B3EA83